MNIRNLTWQQVVVLVACLAATVISIKYFGDATAGVTAVVSMVLTFLLGRDPPVPPGGAPTLKLVSGGAAVAAVFVAVLLHGCVPTLSPDAAYAAEQVACASTSRTKAESRACRAGVDRRWGVVDAGADR